MHVVPITAAGPWRGQRDSFGFRLGWVPSSDWERYAGALAIHRASGVQRLCLASDAFFGDDHLDPEGALMRVDALGSAAAGLAVEGLLDYAAGLPHAGDDATFVVLERLGMER